MNEVEKRARAHVQAAPLAALEALGGIVDGVVHMHERVDDLGRRGPQVEALAQLGGDGVVRGRRPVAGQLGVRGRATGLAQHGARHGGRAREGYMPRRVGSATARAGGLACATGRLAEEGGREVVVRATHEAGHSM